jgi:predicted transcriptional regulator
MRAAQLFTLQEDILRVLAERPRSTTDIRAQVSGTRGDIVDMLLQLKSDDRIESVGVPRVWKLKGIDYAE